MTLYHRILVPCDFSKPSDTAVRHAADLATLSGAELILLHVLPATSRGARELEDQRTQAFQSLEKLLPPEQILQLKTRFLVYEGRPAVMIVETGRELGVDLIVMGTRGRTGIVHLALGSVAETVLRTALCPVMTVRAEDVTLPLPATSAAAPLTGDDAESAPVIDLLHRAFSLRATDIHLDPASDEEYLVRFRVDGRLEDYCHLDRVVASRQIQQLKILAGMDVAEPFRPKEGSLRAIESLPDVEVRLTTSPVPNGEAVAVRLAARANLTLPLEGLGLAEASRADIEQLLRRGEGMILITGRTGSGKTTTVYALLSKLASTNRNIASIEDPVEYRVPYVRQLQVDERHALTMTSGLKTILRMDPDVVFVGEVRDVETAQIAMRAANAGRIVLSTLHTRDVASTITALRDLHVDARSLAANLSGVINQRLIRRLCLRCREAYELPEAERAVFVAEGLEAPATAWRSTGCDSCRRQGYSGRVGVYEVALIGQPAIAEAITQGVSESALRDLLRSHGTASLRQDALLKVAAGTTSFREVHDALLA